MKKYLIGMLFAVILLGACEKKETTTQIADNATTTEAEADNNAAVPADEIEITVKPTSLVDAVGLIIKLGRFDQNTIQKVLTATPGIVQSMSTNELEATLNNKHPIIVQAYFYQVGMI